MRWLFLVILAVAAATGCSCGDDECPAFALCGEVLDAGVDAGDDGPPPPVIGAVEETRRFEIPELETRAYVLFTESHVPHVYAESEADAARVLGFVTARDRYFMMDLARRLATGTISKLLGQDALENDLESRGMGMARVVERSLPLLGPEEGALFDAYAEGVNAYIEAVRARRVFPPKEYQLAAPIFGVANAADMMAPFTRADIVAIGTVFTYESGYETRDVNRERAGRALEAGDLYAGEPLEALRLEGAWDAYTRVTSSRGYSTASIWGVETATTTAFERLITPPRHHVPDVRIRPHLPMDMLRRFERRADRIQSMLGRDHVEGWGSNAWSIAGRHTTDGAAIAASDGHLGGTVPTPFYRFGMDTVLLGGGDLRQVGLTIPGFPAVGIGTNGDVAWGQTQHFGDITDWYQEEIVLGPDGLPRATIFEGAEMPVTRVDESYEIADVEALGSVGRTEEWPRFETWDGRIITAIEGRDAMSDTVPGPGEAVVSLLGDFVIPGDDDGDGTVSGLSFDYTPLDGNNIGRTLLGWGKARTVREMYDDVGGFVGTSLNWITADSTGSVMYTPYQAMPCRTHLPREVDGSWMVGANPDRLIDGTRFAGFELPLDELGQVDEAAAGSDPRRCVVPRDMYPGAIDPAQGWLSSSNNDPGDMGEDNDLLNDPWYIGGPWHEDFRAARVDEMIAEVAGTIDEDVVERMQSDIRSALGVLMVPLILESIEAARTAAAGAPAPGSSEERMAAMWSASQADYEEFERRMIEWRDRGLRAESGVDTFYATYDEGQRRDAVATTLFNSWLGPFHSMGLGDEHFPGGIYTPTGAGGMMRILTRMIAGRGPGNPLGVAGFNPATEESVFFDVLSTPEVETSREIALIAIDQALAYLPTDPTGPGEGGFGTTDWDQWIWGLRHHTSFDSILLDFISAEDTSFGFLIDMFTLSTDQIPLMEGLAPDDPRADLPGFPRGGDNYNVDAASSGFRGRDFGFGGIAVWRMVVAPRGEMTTARNILPGGQSGNPDTPYYDDQARLWLANEATPMRFAPDDVVAGATERETFVPSP